MSELRGQWAPISLSALTIWKRIVGELRVACFLHHSQLASPPVVVQKGFPTRDTISEGKTVEVELRPKARHSCEHLLWSEEVEKSPWQAHSITDEELSRYHKKISRLQASK